MKRFILDFSKFKLRLQRQNYNILEALANTNTTCESKENSDDFEGGKTVQRAAKDNNNKENVEKGDETSPKVFLGETCPTGYILNSLF